jgi:hypothetical protein
VRLESDSKPPGERKFECEDHNAEERQCHRHMMPGPERMRHPVRRRLRNGADRNFAKEKLMRKLIAIVAAPTVLAGVGLAIHTAALGARSVAFTLIELLVVIA